MMGSHTRINTNRRSHCDASVVSRYTAYVAVDEAQNKPVSGSMQAYEFTTATATTSYPCSVTHFHSFGKSTAQLCSAA